MIHSSAGISARLVHGQTKGSKRKTTELLQQAATTVAPFKVERKDFAVATVEFNHVMVTQYQEKINSHIILIFGSLYLTSCLSRAATHNHRLQGEKVARKRFFVPMSGHYFLKCIFV